MRAVAIKRILTTMTASETDGSDLRRGANSLGSEPVVTTTSRKENMNTGAAIFESLLPNYLLGTPKTSRR